MNGLITFRLRVPPPDGTRWTRPAVARLVGEEITLTVGTVSTVASVTAATPALSGDAELDLTVDADDLFYRTLAGPPVEQPARPVYRRCPTRHDYTIMPVPDGCCPSCGRPWADHTEVA